MIRVRLDKKHIYIALTRISAQEYIDGHPEHLRKRMDIVNHREPKENEKEARNGQRG